MEAKHTPGPWKWTAPESDPGWSDCGPWLVGADGTHILMGWGHDAWGLGISDWKEPPGYPAPPPDSPNARLIAAAPDLFDQVRAVSLGWTVEKRSLFDEEGVEGWVWIEPNGTEHAAAGDWNAPPPWPASARAALAGL